MKIRPVVFALVMLAPAVQASSVEDSAMAEISKRCALYRSGNGVIGMDRTELEQDCAMVDAWTAEQKRTPKDTRPLPTINEVGQREAVHKLDTTPIEIDRSEQEREPNLLESLFDLGF